jgi:hypothetical protein
MGNGKVIIAAILGLSVSVAWADKLSDFEAASKEVDDKPQGKAGCKSISYSDYRSTCESEGGHVHEWCDGSRGPITCDSENISRQVRDNLERAKNAAEELRKQKSTREDDQSRANTPEEKQKIGEDIKKLSDQIYEADKQVEQSKKDFDTRKKLVDDAIYVLDQCITYRRAVQNSFGAALDKVRNEDETPRIKELAEKLRNSYGLGKDGHEEQIKNKTNSLETCKSSRL